MKASNFIKKSYRKVRNHISKYMRLKRRYPAVYRKAAKAPVREDKIIFIELRLPELTNSFQSMYNELSTHYNFDIHCHFLRMTFVSKEEQERRCIEMIKDVATAKYVFLDEASNIFSSLPLREETIVTQLWHGCGAFKKFGLSTADLIFGENRKNMMKYPFNKNYTHVTVSSPEVIWAYEEAMDLKDRPGVVKALGSSRTDVFFNKSFKKKAYQKLYELMPEAKGKKVILYAPTFRGRVASAKSPDCFDVSMFADHFSEDYVLLFKHHPLVRVRPEIPEEYEEFAKDFTDTMAIDELLCVSDICISDYSSLVFEYSLFEKPMIFYAYDLDEYFDWRGFYYDYYELAPGPIVTTNEEMIDYIENIGERFEKAKVKAFKEKFMSACDGHATKRILDTVVGEAILSQHRVAGDLPEEEEEEEDDGIKVSVIVPVYNCSEYLPQCMDSIRKQSLAQIEIICVDDGSTDDTPALLEQYAEEDDRIKIIHQKNQYAGVARNNGLKQANGKYVAFWDGDDFFHEDALQIMYEKAEDTQSEIVVCGAFRYNNETNEATNAGTYTYLKRKYLPDKEVFSKEDIPGEIFNFTNNVPWNKLYLREFVLQNHLEFQPSKSYNDMYFVMKALYYAKRISTVKDKLVYYRINVESSLTGKASTSPLCILEQYELVCRDIGLDKERNEIKQSFANTAFRAFLYSLDIQKTEEGYKMLFDTFKEKYKDMLFVKDEPGYYYVEHMDEWEHKLETSDAIGFLLYRSWYYKQSGIDKNGEMVREIGQRDRELKKRARIIKQKDKEIKENKKEINRQDKILKSRTVQYAFKIKKILTLNGLLTGGKGK